MARNALPKYLSLKRELLKQIRSSKSGSRISSEYELVARYSISRATVAKAIGELVNEGYLYREQGRGTFVAESQVPGNGAIGVLYYSSENSISSGNYFGMVFRGIEQALAQVGRDILLIFGKREIGQVFHPPSPTELARKDLAGLITIGIDSDDHLASLAISGLPSVSVDYHSPRLDMDAVVGDNIAGACNATGELLRRVGGPLCFMGITRTGSRQYMAPDCSSLERMEGFRIAHQQAGLELCEELIMQPRQEPINFLQRLETLRQQDIVPKGVLSHVMGSELDKVMKWAKSNNLDIEFFGADSLPTSNRERLPAVRICEDPIALGQEAVNLVLERVAGMKGPARVRRIPCKLIKVSPDALEEVIFS
jgi:GntR family transcriptional regulator, arabinose operon transcriptional repressor